VPATAAVYRRGLFDRVGFFDEGFESYLEDVELGLRCALAECRGEYEPCAVAWHHGSATLGAWHPDTVRRLARNQMRLAARYTGLTWPVLAGQALWGLVALRHGRFGAWLCGKREGWRARPPFERPARALLAASEDRILAMQRASGWDTYWRAYFLLTRGVVR
jgi:GT2 family glycosyltransferase